MRPRRFVEAALSGEPIGLSREMFFSRMRAAADAGDLDARRFLTGIAETDRLMGRAPRRYPVTPELFARWTCPACGSRAATASGRDATLKCQRGHVRTVEGNRPTFSLSALLARH